VGYWKTPKYTFSATLVEFVGGDWQKKWLEPQKNEIVVFFPAGLPNKKISTSFIILSSSQR